MRIHGELCCKEGRYKLSKAMTFASNFPSAHGIFCHYIKLSDNDTLQGVQGREAIGNGKVPMKQPITKKKLDLEDDKEGVGVTKTSIESVQE